jgi:protein-L-isoaspartate(D-aspartate) O-methyltransferase
MVSLLSLILWCSSSFSQSDDQDYEDKRKKMVVNQIQARGITDDRVLNALLKVKRHLFVPERIKLYAYEDNALPIDNNQTISQPYIVALMTDLAKINPQDKVLEIGTGSGYQAAILAELAKEVYSIEIIKELADEARAMLSTLGYKNIEIRHGDGYLGWREAAPFDAIIVTAAAKKVPLELVRQLKPGGRMVIPLGDFFQDLYVVTKKEDGSIMQQHIIPVRFVPMVHGAKKED